MTTSNIVFTLSDINRFTENDIYRLFGMPETQPLETESGKAAGSEAPKYIVKELDFLSSEENIVSNNVCLIDFDQSFAVSSPPEKMLGTPVEYLAPEVAAGLKASPASDIWALGCCIFRLRSGEGLFSAFDITSPADLLRAIIQALGDLPGSWEDTLFDYDGQPTKDTAKGEPLWKFPDKRPIKDRVYMIWDEPKNEHIRVDTAENGPKIEGQVWYEDETEPCPPSFSHMLWKPRGSEVGRRYIYSSEDEDETREALPKIPENGASLLYDLLSKIFLYDQQRRISARELLDHPWFHIDI